MAAGGIAAAGALLGGVTSAFSRQTRAPGGSAGPRADTSTIAIAATTDKAARKAALKNAQQERVLALLSDPQVMGLLITFGGVLAAQYIPWAENPKRRAALTALTTSSAVLMGLGRAGVGDLTSLTMAAAAAAVTGLDVQAGGGGSDWPLTLEVGGLPIASAFGPIPMLQKVYDWIR